MTPTIKTRCKNMVLGALVADAAAMGLHWIYDQPRIRAVAGDAPEFTEPDPAHYDGVPAYFAHPKRTAGDQSQYGEQTMVMLRALVRTGGQYESATYASEFRTHFGYGGGYVGYIDHATRDTLDNFRRYEDAALAVASSLPFDGDQRLPSALVSKAQPLLATHQGEALRTEFESVVRNSYDNIALVTYAMKLLDGLISLPPASGAHDLQMPAIAKLPALVAVGAAQGMSAGTTFSAQVSSAVRITNDHPIAAVYGDICAHMMLAASREGSIAAVVGSALSTNDPDARALLNDALSRKDQDNAEVTSHFGMACDLHFGVPSALHNITTASSFARAIRRNIYAGGDSCGRAMLVGAVMGAVHGVGGAKGIPQDWIRRLSARPEIEDLLTKLID
ncbi:ADP-ribosylglycohydrolase family protein [Sulfitobacter sp.]|uniref:ADP-ribosylglycohydrolase family protein n=1 Tax=Sulfitobacter sp. TaxID=1903071 RepID=UPI003001478F